jgi:hypothetical protein
MIDLWNGMMEKQKHAPKGHLLFYQKAKTAYHHVYLYYDNISKKGNLGIEFNEVPEVTFPEGKGFQVIRGTLPFLSESKPALIIQSASDEHELFLRLAQDLESLFSNPCSETELLYRIVGRLLKWQNFFQKQPPVTLAASKQKGLAGELLMIRRAKTVLPLAAVVMAWQGPNRAMHDFHLPVHIETKTTETQTPSSIRVHGENQLVAPKENQLILHIAELNVQDEGEWNLEELIREIEEELRIEPEVREIFLSKLMLVGYPISGISNPLLFSIKQERFFCVSESFPSLDASPSIFAVEYSLTIDSLQEWETSWEDVKKHLADPLIHSTN